MGRPVSLVWILKSLVSGFNRLILGLDVTVGILLGKDVFAGISFYVLSLHFGPCRLSEFTLSGPH